MTGERPTGGTIAAGIACFVFGTMWLKIFELVFHKDAQDLGCALTILLLVLTAGSVAALNYFVLSPLGWAV